MQTGKFIFLKSYRFEKTGKRILMYYFSLSTDALKRGLDRLSKLSVRSLELMEQQARNQRRTVAAIREMMQELQ